MNLNSMLIKNIVTSPNFKRLGFLIGLFDYILSFLIIIFSGFLTELIINYAESSALEVCKLVLDYDDDELNTSIIFFTSVNLLLILCAALLVIGIMTEKFILLSVYSWVKPVVIGGVAYMCSKPTIQMMIQHFECERNYSRDFVLLVFVLMCKFSIWWNTFKLINLQIILNSLLILDIISSILFWYCVNLAIRELDEVIVYDFVNRQDNLTKSVKNYYDTPEIFDKDKPSTNQFHMNVPEYLDYLKGLETEDDDIVF